jgi:hypothetical protein
MPETRGPGRDRRTWKPEDISFSHCPFCGAEIEFWKDESFRAGRVCGRMAPDSKLDRDRARWCARSDESLKDKPTRRIA